MYDPFGLVSPTTLVAKLLYRDICDAKMTWDGQLPDSLLKRWKDWRDLLTKEFTVPTPFTPYHIAVAEIKLHSFGDASSQGVCAAVCAAIRQGDEVTQGLVCAKSRIAKRNLTIPRIELVASHMTVNIASNVEAALSNYEVGTHCCLDSTVALYCIKGRGDYRQFVANRVQEIQQHEHLTWHHVPTAQNPEDLGSRGGSVENHQLWSEGPTWLRNPSEWPTDVILESTPETRPEAKAKREILAVVATEEDEFDLLIGKYNLPKPLRIGLEEVQRVKLWWIRRAQFAARLDARFEADQLRLNLQLNDQQILQYRGG